MNRSLFLCSIATAYVNYVSSFCDAGATNSVDSQMKSKNVSKMIESKTSNMNRRYTNRGSDCCLHISFCAIFFRVASVSVTHAHRIRDRNKF